METDTSIMGRLLAWWDKLHAEDNEGHVPSSARFISLALTACVVIFTWDITFYVLYQTLYGKTPEATTIAAIGGCITASVGGLAYVMGKRDTQ